ncbi:NnrS family protein [Labrenzia sp. 011]|uniref:NnrS family protein n=1 Tax=Labrenzia sp. 011 TaxID=2171494 RepID=UPI000D510DF7|nr:NnrS family protein [Labrenzia sp. 011]PVB62354.1 short-chain dehydrogenase [Labrenzia sp. 011]
MSCGPACQSCDRPIPTGLWSVLADEGFRLFFTLGAVYAALSPFLWVLAFGLDLPFATTVPPQLWHGHEMLVGAFGAALIGFLTTAAPEWTDTSPIRGRGLWLLAALWLAGRAGGLTGWDGPGTAGAVADLAWMSVLLVYLLKLSWRQRTDRLLAFALWLAILIACTLSVRIGFWNGHVEFAARALHLVGLAYLGLLGLALSRISVPVTNHILDPSEATSPFRPHPGRLNLAPGLVFVAMAGDIAGLSPGVSGFLLMAAGAAFVDRVAEAFIGRAAFQSEILMLAGSSAFAGTGLMLAGAARLGAPWAEVTGLHLAFLGGLGLGVYSVYCIAGKLHSGQALGQSRWVRLGALCLCLSAFLRVAPDFGLDLPGPYHGIAVSLWSMSFCLWLVSFWPYLSRMEAGPPDSSPAGSTRDAKAA